MFEYHPDDLLVVLNYCSEYYIKNNKISEIEHLPLFTNYSGELFALNEKKDMTFIYRNEKIKSDLFTKS